MNPTTTYRWIPLGIATAGAFLLLASGVGARMGVWDFRFGFTLLRWAAYIGAAGAVAALLTLAVRRPSGGGLALMLGALVIGLITFGVPWNARRMAQSVPPIHDITTDLGNPPAFLAILPLRADAPNSAEYGGPEVAAQQRAAYPDIVPLLLEADAGTAFTRALAAARDMGWEVIVADSALGRIEAVATTRWFGFIDDVVVRLTPDGSRTRVDVRSVSRVGGSDAGANASRIQRYLARLAT